MAHEKAFDGVPTLREFIAFVYERSFEPCVLEACNEVMLAMENQVTRSGSDGTRNGTR